MVALLVLSKDRPDFASLSFRRFPLETVSQNDELRLQSAQKEDSTNREALGFQVIEAGFEFGKPAR